MADQLLSKLCDFSNLSAVLKEIIGKFTDQYEDNQAEISRLRSVVMEIQDSVKGEYPVVLRELKANVDSLRFQAKDTNQQVAQLQKWRKLTEDKMYDQRICQLEETVRKQNDIIDALRISYEAKADRVEILKDLSNKANKLEMENSKHEVLRTASTLREEMESAVDRMKAEHADALANLRDKYEQQMQRITLLEGKDFTLNVNANVEKMLDARTKECEQRLGAAEAFQSQITNRVSMAEGRIMDNNQTAKRFAGILESLKERIAQEAQDREDLAAKSACLTEDVGRLQADGVITSRQLETTSTKVTELAAVKTSEEEHREKLQQLFAERFDRIKDRLTIFDSQINDLGADVEDLLQSELARRKKEEREDRQKAIEAEIARRERERGMGGSTGTSGGLADTLVRIDAAPGAEPGEEEEDLYSRPEGPPKKGVSVSIHPSGSRNYSDYSHPGSSKPSRRGGGYEYNPPRSSHGRHSARDHKDLSINGSSHRSSRKSNSAYERSYYDEAGDNRRRQRSRSRERRSRRGTDEGYGASHSVRFSHKGV
mmetsp:Transcript_4996/g.7943  ORF Transcript_4996/g.7943 Transcript_4996/m.7943 type:complete len:543 (-) Transcript_4996:53-1681(-)